MKDFKGGMRFIGSNNSHLEKVTGPTAAGVLIERLPQEYWDSGKDPEWIVKYDASCVGETRCVRESILRRFKMSAATA